MEDARVQYYTYRLEECLADGRRDVDDGSSLLVQTNFVQVTVFSQDA